MGVTKFTGADAMLKRIADLRKQLPDRFAAALREVAEVEAAEARKRVPVETGKLQKSIHVEGPYREGKMISVKIVAGGSEAPYALEVHEDLSAHHKNGEAKFIERPLTEAAPFIRERVARSIEKAAS